MKQPATLFAAPEFATAPPSRPAAPSRDRGEPARETLPLTAPATPAAFAVATWDAGAGRLVFLSRSASPGNLMSTPDPLWARTWQAPAVIRDWAAGLPPESKAQLAARPRLIVPVVASAGEAVGMLEVDMPVPAAENAA